MKRKGVLYRRTQEIPGDWKFTTKLMPLSARQLLPLKPY